MKWFLNNQKTESKYDANVLKSIADTYASMQNYGIQGDVVEDLQEGALEDKAKKSGISVGTLKKVYNRGMAAWKTGHRWYNSTTVGHGKSKCIYSQEEKRWSES